MLYLSIIEKNRLLELIHAEEELTREVLEEGYIESDDLTNTPEDLKLLREIALKLDNKGKS